MPVFPGKAVGRRRNEPCSCRPKGVAQREGAAQDVELFKGDIPHFLGSSELFPGEFIRGQAFQIRENLSGKGLMKLEDIYIR